MIKTREELLKKINKYVTDAGHPLSINDIGMRMFVNEDIRTKTFIPMAGIERVILNVMRDEKLVIINGLTLLTLNGKKCIGLNSRDTNIGIKISNNMYTKLLKLQGEGYRSDINNIANMVLQEGLKAIEKSDCSPKTHMKIYSALVSYHDTDYEYTKESSYLVVSTNVKKAVADARTLYTATLPDDFDYISDGKVSIKRLRMEPMSDFADREYTYIIPVAGGYIDGTGYIQQILDTLTKDDDRYFANRKVIIKEIRGNNQYVLYYAGKCNQQSLNAINRCIHNGVDPYGV